MTKKLTAEEKIAKTLEYCEYSKQLAVNEGHMVRFQVEIENTDDGAEEAEQQLAGNHHTAYISDSREFLHWAICRAAMSAKQNSRNFNNSSSVRVWIMTYDKSGAVVDEEVLNDYEINFERGVEV